MPTVSFGACLSNYWLIWTINGLGSIFGLVINMAISYFVLKHFHKMTNGRPSAFKKPKSNVSQILSDSPVSIRTNDTWVGNTYNMSRV